MQLLWLHIVQFFVTLGFKFYYKNIHAVYEQEIPKDKAVIFLSNHQNALLDPLLITIKSTRKNYFLTRAGVFKNPKVAKILQSLQMLPVYRMMDGVDIREKNKEIFNLSSNLLLKKKSIILFPEGNHGLKRRVRPLKKGFSRIINETFIKDESAELVIIPIGLNYQTPTKYGDSMSVYFGKHIDPKEFWNDGNLNFLDLADKVSSELKKLTTHIESLKDYEIIQNKLNSLNVDFTNPIKINECIKDEGKNYTGKITKGDSKIYVFLKNLLKIYFFIPYWVWKKIAFTKIKEDEFIGTFRYAIIMSITPIYLLLLSTIMFSIFGSSIGISTFMIGFFLPLFTLRVK